MRFEVTPPSAPSTADLLGWVFDQPAGFALALLLVLGWYTERIFTGAAMRRERDRADKLQRTVDELSAGLTKATDVSSQSLESQRLSLALIQGIDELLRRKE